MGPWAFSRGDANLTRHRLSEEVAIEPADRTRRRRGEAVSSHRSGVVPASAFVPARLDAILAASVALAAASPTEERKRSFFSARDGHSALVPTLPRRRLGRGRTTQAFARAMAFDAFERSARPRLEAAAAWRRRETTVVRPGGRGGSRPGASSPASLRAGVRASDVAGRSRRGGGLPEHEPPSVLAAERARRARARRRSRGRRSLRRREKIHNASAADSAALVPGTHCCYAYARAAARRLRPRLRPARRKSRLARRGVDGRGRGRCSRRRRPRVVPAGALRKSRRVRVRVVGAANRGARVRGGTRRRNRRVGPRRRSWVAVQTRGLARARGGEARGGPAAAAEEEEDSGGGGGPPESSHFMALAGFARDDAEAETETGGDAFFFREIALAEIETGVWISTWILTVAFASAERSKGSRVRETRGSRPARRPA